MNITNRLNLPGPIFRALAHDGYTPGERKADISVTSLIGSPLISELRKRHDHEITEDASDRVWSLLGHSVHYVCEHAANEDSIAEKRLYMDIDGWTLTGQTDLFEGTTENKKIVNVISDFKVTSIFSFLLGLKEEWVAQVNLNAMLWRNAGHQVHRGQIIAILKDWQSSKARIDQNYPQCAVNVVNIPLWDQASAIAYAKKRIALHKAARATKDPDKIPTCTDEEKWYRNGSFAVMKVGNKKATAVRSTLEDAKIAMHQFQIDRPKDKFEIVERPGEYIRCTRFCTVKNWCKFYRENLADSIVNDTEE